MLDKLTESIQNGFAQLRSSSQLVYTLISAITIAAAFIFVVWWFVNIASNAQDELFNVRAGSIHDGFVPFVAKHLDDPDGLRENMKQVTAANQTIDKFQIIQSKEVEGETKYVVSVALNKEAEGKPAGSTFPRADQVMFAQAAAQPGQPFTRGGEDENGDPFFKTVKAVTDDTGKVVAFSMTTQGLSQADQEIMTNLRNGIIIFVLLMILVMALFLRHSRIVDYAHLYNKLKELDRMKDDFISMASHELRTPLTHIRGYVDMLKEKIDQKETKEQLEQVDVQARELDGLVADMLDVKRLEQGRMKFEMETLQPHGVIRQVVEDSKHSAENKGLKLSCEINDKARIYVDESRLKQVLNNLVGNAVKYTEQGDSITVKQYTDGDRLVIRVSDTGKGMSSEEQKQLFQKFSRVGSNDQQKHIKGTGLGLWITNRIVQQMNGRISVESIEGVGSDFVVSFSIVQDSEQ